MSVEIQIGEIRGEQKAQGEKLDRVLDGMERIIPVLATHAEKHRDFEENWQPKIEEHEKKVNWVIGAFKVVSALFTSIGVIAGIVMAWFHG